MAKLNRYLHVTRQGRIKRNPRRKFDVARVLHRVGKQRGRTTAHDKTLTAMLPGKRVSRHGKIYYERRADRSDTRREHGVKTRRYKRRR